MRSESRESHASQAPDWVIQYATPEMLRAAFRRELIHGALFLQTQRPLESGAEVNLVLDLQFRGERIELTGRVVGVRRATRLGTPPGVSIRLHPSPAALRMRLEQVLGEALPEADPTPPGLTKRAPRFAARTRVELALPDRRVWGESVNISCNGLLVLIPAAPVPPGAEVALRIESPDGGAPFEIAGRVSNHARCRLCMLAVGVQFLYPLERFEEVSRFVDALRSFDHARSLASIHGSLADTSLETLLDTFCGVSDSATLWLRQGDLEGVIVYRDGMILRASAGLASGVQALARMLSWKGAGFELCPDAEVVQSAEEPLPLATALLAASVERDELARVMPEGLGPEAVFTLDSRRFAALEDSLDEFAHEVVESAALGFPLDALVDFFSARDADFFRTLTGLIHVGVLRAESGAPPARPA